MAADRDHKTRKTCAFCGKRRYEKYMTFVKVESEFLRPEYSFGSWVCMKGGILTSDTCAVKWYKHLYEGVEKTLKKMKLPD